MQEEDCRGKSTAEKGTQLRLECTLCNQEERRQRRRPNLECTLCNQTQGQKTTETSEPNNTQTAKQETRQSKPKANAPTQPNQPAHLV